MRKCAKVEKQNVCNNEASRSASKGWRGRAAMEGGFVRQTRRDPQIASSSPSPATTRLNSVLWLL
jgi:hypothetical protein